MNAFQDFVISCEGKNELLHSKKEIQQFVLEDLNDPKRGWSAYIPVFEIRRGGKKYPTLSKAKAPTSEQNYWTFLCPDCKKPVRATPDKLAKVAETLISKNIYEVNLSHLPFILRSL